MYNTYSTLNSRPVPRAKNIMLLSPRIQVLDVNENNFYSALLTANDGPLVISPSAIKPENASFIDARNLRGLAVSVFKLSVAYMYADMRGVYLEYHAPNNESKNNFTLFVQWKELGVMNPGESHFNQFLSYLKDGILSKHVVTIVGKSNKAKKTVFKAIDSIGAAVFERYQVSENRYIETSCSGGWILIKGDHSTRHDICLEQLTLRDLT